MSLIANLFSSASVLTDEQAMWRVQMQDDHGAFAELVRRWEEPIRHLCARMTGDEHRGEDLAQETFVRVFAGRAAFDPGRRFSTWLWRIALNLCHDEQRRANRRQELFLGEDEPGGPAPQTLEAGPDEHLLEQERAGLVRTAIMSLPETHRTVLVLREYEGLKLREVAEVLEIPVGTVKSRLADALTQLSRRLKPLFLDRPPAAAVSAGPERQRHMP
jgi:RNA polymerase sigma-70 factor, ECF subfamily